MSNGQLLFVMFILARSLHKTPPALLKDLYTGGILGVRWPWPAAFQHSLQKNHPCSAGKGMKHVHVKCYFVMDKRGSG